MLRATKDRKSTRLNSSHTVISYAVFCLKKKKKTQQEMCTLNEDILQCIEESTTSTDKDLVQIWTWNCELIVDLYAECTHVIVSTVHHLVVLYDNHFIASHVDVVVSIVVVPRVPDLVPLAIFMHEVALSVSFSMFFLIPAFLLFFFFFFFNDTATTEIYTLSLHDALPICQSRICRMLQAPDELQN